MKNAHIDICGITPQHKLPKCSCNCPYKEICQTYKLCVPSCKPDIETILQLFIDTSIKKTDILCTPIGKKLVIYGMVHIKVLYVANTSSQSVHSAHFDIPFCTFMMLNKVCYSMENLCAFIEDTFVNQLDCRNFYISMLLFIYPMFKTQDDKHIYDNNCLEKLDTSHCENIHYAKFETLNDSEIKDYNYADNFNNKNYNYINNNESHDLKQTMQSTYYENIDHNLQPYEETFNNSSIKPVNYSNCNCNINELNNSNIEYDMPNNISSDIDYEINYDMNSDNTVNTDLSSNNEYFEYEYK